VDTGVNAGEHLRNACTELTSRDDNDICNLGSINLARVTDVHEMSRLTYLGTAFLLAGTLYSKVPYEEVAETRTKNRRLGLGVMGMHEWLAMRGKPYAPDPELESWLIAYSQSGLYADNLADRLGISRPVKTRAIAPTGTIGILAETTTGIEPVFAKAIKRRYLKGDVWHFQYVIDASVQRMVDRGLDPETIEDAYDLASDPDRRLRFQAWVQKFVDHGISSTLNLPAREDQAFTVAEFGQILLRHLPNLRGVTVYPDGARGGQPLTKVPYQEAADWEGREYEEVGNSNACVSGSCGV
jgi:ribonucleoside-diphosphate reductase alpha chain